MGAPVLLPAFFAGRETSTMRVTAHDAAGTLRFERLVTLTGHAVAGDAAAASCSARC